MTNPVMIDLEEFPAIPFDENYWLHEDGRTFFIWPARDRKTGQVIKVEVEVTNIRSDAVAEQLKPSRTAIELAARELYRPGSLAVRLMRPDTYWMQRSH